jgi:type I restriction enzyme R subunit
MPSSLASEFATVQEPLIRHAVGVGWTRLSEQDALTQRRGATGLLLYGVLREKLIELNPGVVSPENVDSIIQRIEGARANIEGNAEVLAWVRGERTVYVESEKRHRNVTVVELDLDKLERNRFHVTDEWEFTNGRKTNRADVVFLVNGVPLVVVEAKSSRKSVDEGVVQIRRYHAETPEMMTAPQVFDTTNLLDFYYGATWSLERKNLFNWRDEEPGNFERKVKRFFARERFLRMIGDWILFFKKDDELKKAILRQHQTRAVERVVERTLDPARQRGLVWHTQGSGKTFTMMKAAELILRHPSLEGPTVVMLVDRNELESQLFANLAAHAMAAEVAASKRHLRDLLASDYRGLVVSMIHKFDKADAGLCTRENVVVLVDEAHRTTGGDLGNYLVGALPNSTIIGFTGTPVDKTAYGQGTFKVFGKDDHPKGYLDKYSIADSVADGTTLELHYTLAPNEIRVPHEVLDREFWALKETEGISDLEELNKILEKAVVLRTFLKAPDRVERVARFLADHFRENVDPLGYKAFVVGVDREACALYKKALDKHLPPEWSEVIYTSAHNDSEQLAEFRLGPDDEKKIRKAFTKRDGFPKILIVTEKLLTGFDAPILYCLYLDKPMRDHTLLQAIARVNRPYEDERGIAKPCGFVVDFVGIFERLQDALSFDSDEVSSVIKNVEVLKTRFERLMTEEARPYLALCKGRVDDKAVERAIEALADKGKREAFFELFEEVQTLHEVLSPDVFLRPWIDDFGSLCVLYRIARNAFASRTLLLKDLMRKTEALVKQHANSTGIDGTLPVVKIDEQTLRALKESASNEESKVINLGRSLIHSIQTDGGDAPHLIPIGQRAEEILEKFGERQEETEKALHEIQQLADDYLEARAEAEHAGFDPNTFGIFWVLKNAGLAEARDLATPLNQVFSRRPTYRDNPAELRVLKAEVYKILLPVAGKDRMVGLADELLRLARA